jgi:hypothetical protein
VQTPLVVATTLQYLSNQLTNCMQESIRHLLSPDVSGGDTNAAGTSLDVLAILKRSYSQLPSDSHRCSHIHSKDTVLPNLQATPVSALANFVLAEAFSDAHVFIKLCCRLLADCCCSLRRQFFLDAALLMRSTLREHLLLVWAGILQQQQDERGEQRPDSPAQLRRMAVSLWTACAGATLISCHTPSREHYSRCMLAGRLLSRLSLCVYIGSQDQLPPASRCACELGIYLTIYSFCGL